MRGFKAQFTAECIRIARSPFFMLFSVLMPLAFYSLFTMLNGADAKIGDVSWGGYSLMSMTAFSLIGTAAGQFGIRLSHERKDGLTRLLRLTPLSTGAWVLAKLVSHLLIHAAIIAVMFVFSALVFGTEMPAGTWVMCGLWLLIGSVPFLALGILIGTIKSTDIATAVSNVVYMGISVAGGLWMPLSSFPGWMQKAGEWLPSHAYADGAWSLLEGQPAIAGNLLLLLSYGIGFLMLSAWILNGREAG
ncbi:ABC transporter permease [Paenibacillus nanensis]